MRSGAASPICTSKKTLCVITGSAAAARVAQATTKRERNLDIFEWWLLVGEQKRKTEGRGEGRGKGGKRGQRRTDG